jgi:hypothetical protein
MNKKRANQRRRTARSAGARTREASNQDRESRRGGSEPSDIQTMNRLLQVAVPLHMLSLYERGGITRSDLLRAQAEMEEVGQSTDSFLNGHARPGEAATIFNRIARAIAVLSYMPGGVPAFEQHYEARAYLAGLLGEEVARRHWESAIGRCFGQEDHSVENPGAPGRETGP